MDFDRPKRPETVIDGIFHTYSTLSNSFWNRFEEFPVEKTFYLRIHFDK